MTETYSLTSVVSPPSKHHFIYSKRPIDWNELKLLAVRTMAETITEAVQVISSDSVRQELDSPWLRQRTK